LPNERPSASTSSRSGLSIQNARGHRTTFEYDDAGRVNEQVDPVGRRTMFQYD
jgi:YD repeat-containing protein